MPDKLGNFLPGNLPPQPEYQPLTPKAECTVCEDMGFVVRRNPNVPPGDVEWRKTIPCPNPMCRVANENRMRTLEGLMKDAGVKDGYRRFSFATWDAMPPNLKAGKYAARLAMQMYTQRNGQPFALNELHTLVPEGTQLKRQIWEAYKTETTPKPGVILAGVNGVGKTGLTAGAALEMLEKYTPVLFLNALEMVGRLFAAYGDNENFEIKQHIKNASHLFLDEMTFEVKDSHRREFQEITRHRHDAGLPMVMTTNFSPDEFEQWFSPQIATGIFGACHWIDMGGEVLRNEIPALVRRGQVI